ncbi:hypothetical protein DFH06DRAFT_1247453 [Mycena polygramma]|nr:hypothetical protein DFH06DRAFT_1247453 [Mycena polygramma]
MPPNAPKKLKFKTYRIPESRHYIFIQNPWPFDVSVSTARIPPTYVNAVVAWICCMVRDLCDTEIDKSNVRIFYQSTHRDLIAEIELATLTSVGPLLGAHHSFTFLTPKHVGDANHTSVIYEYNYERFNSPERTNWTTQMATYTYLPPDFAIKNESVGFAYPTPSPSDAKRPQSAKPLPGRLILGHPECPPEIPVPLPPPPQGPPAPLTEPVVTAPPQRIQPEVTTVQRPPDTNENTAPEAAHPPPHISRSPPPSEPAPPSEFAFAPYEPPLHFPRARSPGMPSTATASQPSNFANKRDPYEEEEEEQELLKEPTLTVEPDERVVKLEVKKEEVKEEEASRPLSQMREIYAQVQEMSVRNAESTGATEEEEELQRLQDTRLPVAAEAHARVQSEVKEEEEYRPSAQLLELHAKGQSEMRVRDAESAEATERVKKEVKVERGDESVRVKTENKEGIKREACEPSNLLAGDGLDAKPPIKIEGAVKQEQGVFKTEDAYVPSQALQELFAQGQEVRRERLAVKPEPSDAPIPRAPPRNKRFDPFDGYEPEVGDSTGGGVKREEGTEFNTRQAYMPHASSPSAFPRPIKREEFSSGSSRPPPPTYSANVKQEYEQRPYTSRDSSTYSPGVKYEDYNGSGYSNRGAAQPPQNLSYYYQEPLGPSSNGAYPPNNISSGGHRDAGGHSRDRSRMRTYSPPSRAVKRERDSYDDGPPVKRERPEQGPSAPVYTNTTASNTSNPSPKPNLNDPRVRARIEREEREREVAKRARLG